MLLVVCLWSKNWGENGINTYYFSLGKKHIKGNVDVCWKRMSDENRSESSSNIPLYIILILRYKVFYIFRKQDSAKVGVNHEVEKSKLQSECMKFITQLWLFSRAAVKPFHNTRSHDPKQTWERAADSMPRLVIPDFSGSKKSLPTSAASQAVLPGNQCCQDSCRPTYKEWSWSQYLYYTDVQWITHFDLNLLVLLPLPYTCIHAIEYGYGWCGGGWNYFVESVLFFHLYMDSKN